MTAEELAEYDALFGMEDYQANEGWGDRFLLPGQELLAEVRRLQAEIAQANATIDALSGRTLPHKSPGCWACSQGWCEAHNPRPR
jgi:hypothetical protein